MKIEMMRVDDLIPYDNNPRKNDKAVKVVAESIKEFGFQVPITIDKEGIIVTGHTRLRAAKKLKLVEIPVIRLNELTPDQIKAFRLADNKTAEYAEWDIPALMKELDDIQIDMSIFGFEKIKVVDDVVDDEYIVSLPKTPKSKPGDIYQLGNHKLICGDATDLKTIELLMGTQIADAIITDPPYNVAYDGGGGGSTKKREAIINDNLSNNDFKLFLQKAMQVAAAGLKEGGAFYIWHADKETESFRAACESADMEVKQTIIWNKSMFTLGRQDYQWKHEPCLYGWKRGASHYFINDRTWPTVFTEEIDIDKLKLKEARSMLKTLYEQAKSSVMNEDKPIRSESHPTMKPIKLIARLMFNSTNKGESVIDTFGGSGTTLIVAEQLERICYMAELDPQYVDVIIDRWEKLTELTAIKLN